MAFKKGKSGNPSGRPSGSRNKATLAMMALLEKDASTITSKAVELAKGGDLAAIKLIMERLIPVAKDTLISFPVNDVYSFEGIMAMSGDILKAVANGYITPSQAKSINDVLESHRKSLELNDLEKRLVLLEEKQ